MRSEQKTVTLRVRTRPHPRYYLWAPPCCLGLPQDITSPSQGQFSGCRDETSFLWQGSIPKSAFFLFLSFFFLLLLSSRTYSCCLLFLIPSEQRHKRHKCMVGNVGDVFQRNTRRAGTKVMLLLPTSVPPSPRAMPGPHLPPPPPGLPPWHPDTAAPPPQ